MEESKRIRLVFKDEDVLSQAQILDGLNRSWVLLKPETSTVSDLTAHILRVFRLQQTCPNGLILSVAGFVLPSHESTHILKDSDVIKIRKKQGNLLIEGNDKTDGVELLEAGENQTMNTGVLLLANEEFHNEKGGYESDDPEEVSDAEDEEMVADEYQPSTSKVKKNRKRKALEKLQNSKTKKQRAEADSNAANSSDSDKVENSLQGEVPAKDKSHSSKKKDAKNHKNKAENAKSSCKSGVSASGVERAEYDEYAEDTKDANQEIEKRPSRSARRKRAKRQWLREMAKIQNQNATCESEGLRNWKVDNAKVERKRSNGKESEKKNSNGRLKKHRMDAERIEEDDQPKGLLHWNRSPQENFVKGKNKYKRKQNDSFHRKFYQSSDGFDLWCETHDDIHDKPSEKDMCHQEHENKNADSSNQESDEENKVFPIVVKPGHIRFEPLGKEQDVQQNHELSGTLQWNGITSKKKGQKWGLEDRSSAPQNNCKTSNEECSEMILDACIENQPHEAIDFDKLPPLTRFPLEGDLIVYRIVELSSTWTPELSAYRIGKVSCYDTTLKQIMVVPVPEYPIDPKDGDEDSTMRLDNSLYEEDGSLKIDFASLIDVRLFDKGTSRLENSTKVSAGSGNNPHTTLPDSKNDQTENGGANLWDQISEVLKSKKEELSKDSNWEKSPKNMQMQTSSGKSWSYKALRGSALGATMAMLRSKNII